METETETVGTVEVKQKTFGIKKCSLKDREEIEKVCKEIGVESYQITKTNLKFHPDLRLAEDNVVDSCRDMDNEVEYVNTKEFIQRLKEKFNNK